MHFFPVDLMIARVSQGSAVAGFEVRYTGAMLPYTGAMLPWAQAVRQFIGEFGVS
jgi:hypothetical protein